jgi:hypothetical protein
MPDAKRREREAARRAAQSAKAEAWQAKVDLHFAYLRTSYGFRITSADASSVWVTRVVYQSDMAAVAVDSSIEFERVELSVMRLVGGRLPEYPIFILPDTVINQTLFDNILMIRNPNLLDDMRALKGLDNDHIEKSLAFLARALEENMSDFLNGDLSVFEAVDGLIKERVKAHPPIITVHLPEDATAEQEAAAVEEVRKGSPGVQVVARRYRRPTSRKRKKLADNADTSQ